MDKELDVKRIRALPVAPDDLADGSSDGVEEYVIAELGDRGWSDTVVYSILRSEKSSGKVAFAKRSVKLKGRTEFSIFVK